MFRVGFQIFQRTPIEIAPIMEGLEEGILTKHSPIGVKPSRWVMKILPFKLYIIFKRVSNSKCFKNIGFCMFEKCHFGFCIFCFCLGNEIELLEAARMSNQDKLVDFL